MIDYRNANLERQIHRGLQLALFRCVNTKLIRIAPAGRAKFTKGQLKTPVGSDVGAIEDFLSAALYQFVPLIVSSLILIPAIYMVSGAIGLIGLPILFLVVPIASIGAWLVELTQRRSLAEQDQFATAVGEWVKNIRLVRFLGWSDAVECEVISIMKRVVKWTALRGCVVESVWAVTHSWSTIPLIVIIALSSMQQTPLNLVEIFSSFWLLDSLSSRIQHIPSTLTRYGAAIAGAHRLLGLLSEGDIDQLLEEAPSKSQHLPEAPNRIVLRNLSVTYNGKNALDALSLELRLSD